MRNPFKIGTYVRCKSEKPNFNVFRDKIYIISDTDVTYNRDNIIDYFCKVSSDIVTDDWLFCKRFVKATPEEIERYKIEQSTDKYNL